MVHVQEGQDKVAELLQHNETGYLVCIRRFKTRSIALPFKHTASTRSFRLEFLRSHDMNGARSFVQEN